MPEPLPTDEPAVALLKAADLKWERVVFILKYSAAGGLGIVLTFVLIWIGVSQMKSERDFLQNDYLDALKANTASNAAFGKTMEQVADSMEESAEAQGDVATALEKLTMSVDQDQKSDEELSAKIVELLEQFERDDKEPPSAPDN